MLFVSVLAVGAYVSIRVVDTVVRFVDTRN